MIDVSFVIVNRNTRGYLADCLASVQREAGRAAVEVLVVDNASDDGSVEMLTSDHPEVSLIASSENLGFAKASNLGLARAQGRYCVLLNTDTLLAPGFTDSFVSFMDSAEGVGACTPLILNGDHSIQHQCYVRDPDLPSEIIWALGIRRFFPTFGTRPAGLQVREVAHATGACLIIRSSALREVGLLDEAFFFSMEDADICRRIRRQGLRIVHLPTCVVFHFGGVSRSLLRQGAHMAMIESRYRFYRKNYGRAFSLVIASLHIAGASMRLLLWGVASGGGGAAGSRGRKEVSAALHALRWHGYGLLGRRWRSVRCSLT